MKSYFLLPLLFFKFWFIDSPREMFGFFSSLNTAFLQLFSLPLMVKTFFKPLKNEYREGLVRFSKIMGMIIKSIIIFVDVGLFLILLFVEVSIFIGFLAFPLLTLSILFL